MARTLSLVILAGLVLARASASAQAQAPPPPPLPVPTPPADAPAAAPAAPLPDPGEVRVRAESYEQVKKGHIEARGFVDLDLAGMRIQADRADIYEETRPDGKVGHRIVAEGNVVFIRGEERMSGERLEMDDAGRGYMVNAVGYVEPGVWVEAKRVERVDDKTYKVEGGRFTSCSQPNPRWGFQASSAEIEIDEKVKAKNAVFKVKGVPVFYLPYMYYPISSDGRSSGLLFPHFGYSSYRGFNIGHRLLLGRWAAAPTRPSTPTTGRRSATATATSCATSAARPRAAPSAPTSSTWRAPTASTTTSTGTRCRSCPAR